MRGKSCDLPMRAPLLIRVSDRYFAVINAESLVRAFGKSKTFRTSAWQSQWQRRPEAAFTCFAVIDRRLSDQTWSMGHFVTVNPTPFRLYLFHAENQEAVYEILFGYS